MFSVSAAGSQTTSLGVNCRPRTVPICEFIGTSYVHRDISIYSCRFQCPFQLEINQENFASAGNRTRAARVAGEHSTTEPPMLAIFKGLEQGGHSYILL